MKNQIRPSKNLFYKVFEGVFVHSIFKFPLELILSIELTQIINRVNSFHRLS